VPPTVRAALAFAAGGTAVAGVVAPGVIVLAEGVMRAMIVSKLKLTAAVLLAAGVLGTGAGWVTRPGAGPGPARAWAEQPQPKVAVRPAGKVLEIEKAGAALQRGEMDEAYKLLQEAVRKNPSLPPARLMLARLLLATRDGQRQGRAILEQAVVENPDHPEVYLTLGSIALSEGRLTEAVFDCQHALTLSAADRWTADQKKNFQAQSHTGLAAAFEARRDWVNARTHLAVLVYLDPMKGLLRQRLARALFFLDKPDDAYRELTAAIVNDPTLEPAAVTMGRLWTNKGDFTQAREWLDKAIQAEPNSPRARLAYADWLLQQNEIDQAKAHADAAARVKPNDPDVLKLQGLIARMRKDYVTAEATFRRVLNNVRADFFAMNQLALISADQSDGEQRRQALEMAETNARANLRSPEAQATLGYVYYRNGNIEKAWQALQEANAVAPASSSSTSDLPRDTAYYLALVLDKRGKPDEAKKLLKRALDCKGLFVYRQEAQALLDKVNKNEPAKDGQENPKP
jgi:uncharacterized protein (TIGR02996 family)